MLWERICKLFGGLDLSIGFKVWVQPVFRLHSWRLSSRDNKVPPNRQGSPNNLKQQGRNYCSLENKMTALGHINGTLFATGYSI